MDDLFNDMGLKRQFRPSDQQLRIYEGLKKITPLLADFFIDGVKILNVYGNEFQAPSNLVGNLFREINNGIIDILVHEEKRNCFKDKDDAQLKRICCALDVNENNNFAKDWHSCQAKVAKYTHRSNIFQDPRKIDEVKKDWNNFEKTLDYLFGSYHSIIDRIDRLIEYKRPDENQLGALSILMEFRTYKKYFFLHIEQLGWLDYLKNEGYFNPEKHPEPEEILDRPGNYRSTHWEVMNYLWKVAKKNAEEPEEITTNNLLEIVKKIINFRNDNYYGLKFDDTDASLIEIIKYLPIETHHIDFILNAMKYHSHLTHEITGSVLSTLLEKDKCKFLQLFDGIFKYKINDEYFTEVDFDSNIESYFLNEFIEKNIIKLANKCGIEIIDKLSVKINEIIKLYSLAFSYHTVNTIENHNQNINQNKYEIITIRLIRGILNVSIQNNIKTKIEEFLYEEQSIFKRIAIYSINNHYEELNELFWALKYNPFNDFKLKHEIYDLIKDHCKTFNEKEINQIINWIENIDWYIKDETNKNLNEIERYGALRKKEMLIPLLELDNKKIISLYNKYNDIYPGEIEHPGFTRWLESSWGYESPITVEELDKLTNKEIIEYLNNFKEKGEWKEPTIDGLADTFQKSVSLDPNKFLSEINSYSKVRRFYQNYLIRGLNDACKEKLDFDWTIVFNYILELIKSENLWNEYVSDDKNVQVKNLIINVADLIQEWLNKDYPFFNSDLLPQAEDILLYLDNKTKSDLFLDFDYMTGILNSSKGRIIYTLFSYCFKYAELYKKNDIIKWKTSIKQHFDDLLSRKKEPTKEFLVILGQYFNNLYYLDEFWAKNNINNIFPKEDNKLWMETFSAYLLHTSKIYDKIYNLLKENNHYTKALETNFEEHINRQLFDTISTQYFNKIELLEDNNSLISKLISKGDPESFKEIINFVCHHRKDTPVQIKNRTKTLWKKIVDVSNENSDNPEFKIVLSSVANFFFIIDKLDSEFFELLKISAKYIDIQHQFPNHFLDFLLEQIENEPERVGIIFLEIIKDKDIQYPFEQDKIKNIVEKLYQKSIKKFANEICEFYLTKNFEFLRDIYKRYQNN